MHKKSQSNNCCQSYHSGVCGDTNEKSNECNYLDQVWSQLRKIKKQINKKVNRNQFTSALSGKLSLSDISRIHKMTTRQHTPSSATKRVKQNLNDLNLQRKTEKQNKIEGGSGGQYTNNQKQAKKQKYFQSKFINMLFLLDEKLLGVKKQIPNLITHFDDKITQLSDKVDSIQLKQSTMIKDKIQSKIQSESKRISQILACLYQKADRSEVEKLFGLNDLLVIEFQQIKQFTKQIMGQFTQKLQALEHKMNPMIPHKLQNEIDQVISLTQQYQKQLKSAERQIKQLKQNLKELTRLKTNQSQKQINKQNQKFYLLIEQKIDDNIQDLRKQMSSNSLLLRQFSSRLNILQLKENHITKAAMQIQNIENRMETIKIDMHTLANKTDYIGETIKQYCKVSISNFTKEIYQKIENQLSESCQMLTNKMLKLIDSTILREQYEKDTNRNFDKLKRMNEKQSINDHKVDELKDKLDDCYEHIEEQAERTEEQIQKISSFCKETIHILREQIYRTLQDKYINDQQLSDIVLKLDKKIYQEHQKYQLEQQKINQILCEENIIGKWVWSTGKLKGGNIVQWDKQLINTLPQNFKWRQHEDPVAVIVENTGFYRIQMGYYSKKKPTIQVIVNGKTIISAVNSNSYVLHHSSGKLKDVGNNSQIVGLTYVDYLMIKQPSRIVVSYVGEQIGQGFMAIQRF